MLRQVSLPLLFVFCVCGSAAGSTLSLNGTGTWGCGFYPGATGYGSSTIFSFSSEDIQGNPITGNLSWGSPHAAPTCTPGMQPVQGTVSFEGGDVFGNYSYLGQTYRAIGTSASTSTCIQPGCYISVTSDSSGDIAITLGFESSNGLQYLDLSGTANITSSQFGQQPITDDGTSLGNYYYSNGTFTVGDVPEPSTTAMLGGGLMLLIGLRRYRRGSAR